MIAEPTAGPEVHPADRCPDSPSNPGFMVPIPGFVSETTVPTGSTQTLTAPNHTQADTRGDGTAATEAAAPSVDLYTADRVTPAAFRQALEGLFGADPMKWAFQCPSCEDVATGAEFQTVIDENPATRVDGSPARASDYLGQVCLGRLLGALVVALVDYDGRGCDWAANGLIRGPLIVVMSDGAEVGAFRPGPKTAVVAAPAWDDDRPGMMRVHIAIERERDLCDVFKAQGLRDHAGRRGISTAGTKKVLAERIVEAGFTAGDLLDGITTSRHTHKRPS